MCRKLLRSSWLIFLGLICILGTTDAYSTDGYDEDAEFYLDDVNSMEPPQVKRGHSDSADFERRRIFVGKREPAFTPYISVGALSNMQQFFENLKENLDSLENLPLEEREILAGKQEQKAETETKAFRPPATAAYLHAIRNQRPSHRIRNFVANSEPLPLRGSNYYDPSYLWTGLGRKR